LLFGQSKFHPASVHPQLATWEKTDA